MNHLEEAFDFITENVIKELETGRIPWSDYSAPYQTETIAPDQVFWNMYNRPNISDGIFTSPPVKYTPSLDTIYMVGFPYFQNSDEFYSTLFHQLCHSTGHPDRLGRFYLDDIPEKNSEDFVKEELLAEMATTFICWRCNIKNRGIKKKSKSYIQNMSKILHQDKKLVVSAAVEAQQIADYIMTVFMTLENDVEILFRRYHEVL